MATDRENTTIKSTSGSNVYICVDSPVLKICDKVSIIARHIPELKELLQNLGSLIDDTKQSEYAAWQAQASACCDGILESTRVISQNVIAKVGKGGLKSSIKCRRATDMVKPYIKTFGLKRCLNESTEEARIETNCHIALAKAGKIGPYTRTNRFAKKELFK